MVLYSIILIFGLIGLISLVMSYEYMKRSHLILSFLSIVATIGVFIKIGVSKETVADVALDLTPPIIVDNLHIIMPLLIGLVLIGLKAEGTINWIWRRVHPSSAPTDDIRAMERGGVNTPAPKMSAALMGTSTSMFSVPGLDVKTVALIRLSLFALKDFNSKTIIGIENHLKLGDGRRYRAYHGVVAEAQTSRFDLKDIVHPYWRAINGNHAAARNMFTELCHVVRGAGQVNKSTINRIVKIGQALGLSPQDMGLSISRLRL